MEKIKDYSFGIVPILKRKDGILQFLIIQGAKGNNWAFPKGHKEGDETEIETAKRELFEETGISEVDLIDGLRYTESFETIKNGVPADKSVVFYVGFVTNDDVTIQEEEVSDFKWATYEEAMNVFIYENPKRILTQVVEDFKNLNI